MTTVGFIMKNGEYLGYCEEKGYMYSLFMGYDDKGRKLYRIYAIKNNKPYLLIEYTGLM
jgi:hypothetical protein